MSKGLDMAHIQIDTTSIDGWVKLTHIPTGITAQYNESSSQHINKEKAKKILLDMIIKHGRKEEKFRKFKEQSEGVAIGDKHWDECRDRGITIYSREFNKNDITLTIRYKYDDNGEKGKMVFGYMDHRYFGEWWESFKPRDCKG